MALATERERALQLMKTFWERGPKINMCSVGKMKRKWSYFLPAATKKKNVVKVSQEAFGEVFFFLSNLIQKQDCFYKSMRFCDWYIWYVYAAVAIPTVPWLKTEHPPQFPAYQTAYGMFYYAVPVRCRNPQFKVFLLLTNSMSTSRPLARNLPGIWSNITAIS